MNINQVFSGNFLKAEDLQGRAVKVTINKVEVKEFDDGNKIIVSFQGKDKSLVCNKTNANIIAENVGDPDTDNWIGTTHHLTVKKVDYQGRLVPAIRVVLVENEPVAPSKQETPSAPPLPKSKVQHESSEPDDSEVPF